MTLDFVAADSVVKRCAENFFQDSLCDAFSKQRGEKFVALRVQNADDFRESLFDKIIIELEHGNQIARHNTLAVTFTFPIKPLLLTVGSHANKFSLQPQPTALERNFVSRAVNGNSLVVDFGKNFSNLCDELTD